MLGSSAPESGDKIFLTRIWKRIMYPDSKCEHVGTVAYLFACVDRFIFSIAGSR